MPETIPYPRLHAIFGESDDGDPTREPMPVARAQDDVGPAWESVHHMISSVAHGVKNPLGVLLMGTEYLEKKAPGGDPSAARVAEDMRNAIARANAIVRALLDLSAAESPDRQEEDLVAAIEASLAKVESEIARKRIFVARQFASGLSRVPIDRPQFQQAITHLLANAVTASPPRATLTIQAFSTSDGEFGGALIHVVIKDEGTGLQPAVLRRAFEPFFTTNQGGTNAGLGLTVARGIVRAHGGGIALANRDSGGAQASVTFPAEWRDEEQGISRSRSVLDVAEDTKTHRLDLNASHPNQPPYANIRPRSH